MKKPAQHLIAEVSRTQPRFETTIGIDLGDVWSHYCTLDQEGEQEGEVVDRGRFRTTPKGLEKWFTDLPPARIAMEAGTHSIWISEQLQELGHRIIVANVREMRAMSPMLRSWPASLAWIRRFCAPSRTVPSNSGKPSR
jgi:transposase